MARGKTGASLATATFGLRRFSARPGSASPPPYTRPPRSAIASYSLAHSHNHFIVLSMEERTVEQRIRSIAEQHTRLSDELERLATVPRDLANLTEELFSMSGKATSLQTLLKRQEERSRELHEAYGDLTTGRLKKLGLQTSSKKRHKAQVAETARLQSLEELLDVQRRIQLQASDIERAQQQRSRLEEQLVEHNTLAVQLDSLNADLFDGQTPEFPEEDAQEQTWMALTAMYPMLEAELAREGRAREKIVAAKTSMDGCLKELLAALRVCIDAGVPRDPKRSRVQFTGGPTQTAKGVAPKLLNAKTHSGRLYTVWAEVRAISPCVVSGADALSSQRLIISLLLGFASVVKPLPILEILELHLLPGRGSKKALDEGGLHRSMEVSYAAARNVRAHLIESLTSSRERSKRISQELVALRAQTVTARQELNRLRSSIVRAVCAREEGTAHGDAPTKKSTPVSLEKESVEARAKEMLREVMVKVRGEEEDEAAW